jgi:type I restriction enzyme R subunit
MVMVVLVIWHTQGREKYFDGHLCGILEAAGVEKPTIVVQVDRSDLDFQLYENFVLKDFSRRCATCRFYR